MLRGFCYGVYADKDRVAAINIPAVAVRFGAFSVRSTCKIRILYIKASAITARHFR